MADAPQPPRARAASSSQRDSLMQGLIVGMAARHCDDAAFSKRRKAHPATALLSTVRVGLAC